MDGGGEDVYEKNEIVSVVTTKTEDVILVTIIELFAHRLPTLKQTRGRCVKNRLPGTKGRHQLLQCVSCTEVENLLKFYVFPLASLRISFYCWISDTWSGEVKNTFLHLMFRGSFLMGFIDIYFDACNCRKVFGNVWIKQEMQVFVWLWWAKCVMVSVSTTECRKLLLCSAKKDSINVKCSYRLTSHISFFLFSPCLRHYQKAS